VTRHVHPVERDDLGERDHAELGVVGDDHDPLGGLDEAAVGLRLGRVGRGEPRVRVDPVYPQEQDVRVERPQRPVGEGPDEGV
jgi:hypothetical protein